MSKIRVLVVDDVPEITEAFTEALREYDIDVVGTASNGADAITCVRGWRPDVVLMDVRMPVMDGIKATRMITDECLGAKVLMLTAYDDISLIDEAMAAGASGYILKGTLVADTVVAIQNVMRKGVEGAANTP
jgi:response regulator NasT